jgi:hypothetical protein
MNPLTNQFEVNINRIKEKVKAIPSKNLAASFNILFSMRKAVKMVGAIKI